MKQYLYITILILLIGCKKSDTGKSLVDYVNPQIGTISHLLTTPTAEAYLPHSMMHIAPITVSGVNDKYLAQKIYGFPIGNASFMPVSDKFASTPDSFASTFDRDFEIATPYYISEYLNDYSIQCEATVQHQSGIYRISYPSDQKKYMVFFIEGAGRFHKKDSLHYEGWNTKEGTTKYFSIEFDHVSEIIKTYRDSTNLDNDYKGKDLFCVLDFSGSKLISMKVAISFIDEKQAQNNLEKELANQNFETIKNKAKENWNQILSKIKITTENNDQKTVFYTAMYRALNTMQNITENGRYYSVFDHKVHEDSRDFYTCDGLWDSYRVKHPLQMLLNPEQQMDMLESYARMYKQFGTMPVFPFPQGELTYMLGNHLAIFAADAWFKGYRNFDLKTVYEGLRKNAMERTMLPDVNAPKTELDDFYQKNGWFPALKESDKETVKGVHPFYRRQAVAISLENATDDYCMSLLAKELGYRDDQALFLLRAYNYVQVFNKQTHFMSPKMADGNWVPGFDPVLGGKQAGRDYFAECNSWVYTFHVQHDVAGLINLFGSKEAFISRLDSLFAMQFPGYKFDFQKQFPDMTGLTGMHSQGNEPAFHIPYLYCYAGQPWKTQKQVRQIMDAWYFNHPMGLCGDDDDGSLSAWYVFSALGFYPVCPGMGYYVIGSPLFEKTTIQLANGKKFTIIAKNVSKQNKYIQTAKLNGIDWNKAWFTHTDMMKGGILELTMGPKPNKSWGSNEESAPPSMSTL
ncbi:MAG: GH92 family glycosyl hydrolase [Bacteroidales bacterium]